MQIIGNSQGGIKAPPRDLTKQAALELIGNDRFTWRLSRKRQNAIRAIAYGIGQAHPSEAFAINAARETMLSNGRAA